MKSCADCATENDDTRIFCLNCGARLPEASQPSSSSLRTSSVGALAPPLPLKDKNARLRRTGHVNPLVGAFRFSMRMLPLGFLAICALAVYLALQGSAEPNHPTTSATQDSGISPSGKRIPVPVPDPQSIQRSIAALQAAARSRNGAWSADQSTLTDILCHYLNDSTLNGPGGVHIQIDSTTVALEEGRATILLDTRWESLRLQCAVVLAPETRSGGLKARVLSGRIGRLPLSGPAASLLAWVFEPSLAKLEPVLSITESATQASISPKKLVIRWDPARRS